MSQITINEYQLIRDYIEKNCGIKLGDNKEYLVESRLTILMATNGCTTFGQFYKKATEDTSHKLRDKILNAMTTNETLWFRDNYPFDILKTELLPKYCTEFISGQREKLNIWSCGCSSGQEPYSMAMCLLEFAAKNRDFPLEKVNILATDLSDPVLLLALSGRYDEFTMNRGLPIEIRNQFFTKIGNIWEIHDKIKRMVSFKKLNLLDSFGLYPFFDIIFCRNVAIYFSNKLKTEIFEKFYKQTEANGYLFLGGSESLEMYMESYSSIQYERGRYYQKGK